MLGLGASFIVPDADGLSKYFVKECIRMQCMIHQNGKYLNSKLFAPFVAKSTATRSDGHPVCNQSVSPSVGRSVARSLGRSVDSSVGWSFCRSGLSGPSDRSGRLGRSVTQLVGILRYISFNS